MTDRAGAGLSSFRPATAAFLSYPTPGQWLDLPIRAKAWWLFEGPVPFYAMLVLLFRWLRELAKEIRDYDTAGGKRRHESPWRPSSWGRTMRSLDKRAVTT